MVQSNNSNNGQVSDPSKDPFVILMLALVVVAVCWSKQMQIKLWFYNNMIELIFFGVLALVGLGLYIRWRMNKKYEAYLERRRSLREVKPASRQMDYYKRNHLDE